MEDLIWLPNLLQSKVFLWQEMNTMEDTMEQEGMPTEEASETEEPQANVIEESPELEAGMDFGVEQLSDTAREPFFGQITFSVYPCNCEECLKGADKLLEMQGTSKEIPRLHLKMKPLDGTYEKEQQEWFARGKTKMSSWGQLMIRLNGFPEVMDDLKKDGAKTLIGKVFRWEYTEIEVGVDKRKVGVWLPTRIVTGDVLKEYLSSEDTSEPDLT